MYFRAQTKLSPPLRGSSNDLHALNQPVTLQTGRPARGGRIARNVTSLSLGNSQLLYRFSNQTARNYPNIIYNKRVPVRIYASSRLMPDKQQPSYFVIAAVVAAELYRATQVARQIALTASNARSLAMRAGQGAAGFRPITDFIDELASITVRASDEINSQAIAISRIASDTARAESALERFDTTFSKAADAPYRASLDAPYRRTQSHRDSLRASFREQVASLKKHLEELAGELRTATVLAAMSRIEASQAGTQFEQPLNVVAQNVSEAAVEIQRRVKYSQQMFNHLGHDYAD